LFKWQYVCFICILNYFQQYFNKMSKEFGRRLKSEREKLGLTQERFAELGGVKRATQHLYEQGASSPDIEYLLRLDNVGVNAIYLLFGESRQGVSSVGRTISPEVLWQIFDAIEEFSHDETGHPLSRDVRKKFFLMLTAGVMQGGDHANATLIRNEMVRLLDKAA